MHCFKNLHKHPLSCGWRTRKISKSKSCMYFLIQSKSIRLAKVFQKVLISLESHGTGCWVSCGRRVQCRREEGRKSSGFLFSHMSDGFQQRTYSLIFLFSSWNHPVVTHTHTHTPTESLLRSWGTGKERVGAGPQALRQLNSAGS